MHVREGNSSPILNRQTPVRHEPLGKVIRIKMSAEGSDIRIIISGGGTGGHLFPAIAIANALRRLEPTAEILFVGASGRMEMQKVPEAGYEITGLPVAGMVRGGSIRNIHVGWKLFRSMLKAGKIIKRFRPDVVVGVGGYASGPVLKQAREWNTHLIQEQNRYAGVTTSCWRRGRRGSVWPMKGWRNTSADTSC